MSEEVTLGQEARLETFNPNDASAILESQNSGNRKIRQAHVERLALAMVEGNFVLTGEPLIFDRDGNVLDGQHRLAACVLSDVPLTVWTIRNVDPDFMPAIDKGLGRTLADTFAWAGIDNASTAAAITPRLRGLTLDILQFRKQWLNVDQFTLVEFAQEHIDAIALGCTLGRVIHRGVGLSPTNAGLPIAWLIYKGCDPESVVAFGESIASGENLRKGDPIYELRNWVTSGIRMRRRMRDGESTIAVVKTWNAYVQGEQFKLFRVRVGDLLPEVVVR